MDALPDARPAARGSRRIALPVAHWPTQDRAAWQWACSPGDFLEDAGAAAEWRPATVRSAVGAYGRWLAFLRDHDLLDVNRPAADRVTQASIGAYIAHLQAGRSSVTVASEIGVLGMTIQAMVPRVDWGWLWRVQARLQRMAIPTRNKRARVVPVAELVALGHDLMAQAEAAGDTPTLKSAIAYRDGLMIALLALRPLRHKNFVALELGAHLVPVGDGYDLRLDAGETKTGRALECPFPTMLVPALRRYLDHYRPYLLAQAAPASCVQPFDRTPCGRLWITRYGRAMSGRGPLAPVWTRTEMRFGHPVNTHLFRDCAATTVANEDPQRARISATILGHADFRTTEQHYIVANGRAAIASYHDLIKAARDEAKRSRPSREQKDSPTRRQAADHETSLSTAFLRRG